jgi:hypothetical protein
MTQIISLKLTWISCSLMITDGAMGFPQTTEVDSAGVQQPSCARHRIRILGSTKRRPQRCGSNLLLYGTRDFSHTSKVQRVFVSLLTAQPWRKFTRYESARLDRFFLQSPLPASKERKRTRCISSGIPSLPPKVFTTFINLSLYREG